MDSVVIKRDGQICRIVMPAHFTAPLIPELQKKLKQQLAAGDTRIIFDLHATRMLDSSGIGLLTATSNSLAEMGARIEVTAVAPEIFRLLTMMRLVERLNVSARTVSETADGR